jgi:ubiquinone/menaquinone biosynthesis C-methylase UbiE
MNNTQQYLQMQKEYYEGNHLTSEDIVGNYGWQEKFPYETQLLYRRGDIRKPLISDMHEKVALDFACGPGRMVRRMSAFFKRVDGVDISSDLIHEAGNTYPHSNFYISPGDSFGDVPSNTYDFVYSTIAMQHIAVHSIKMNLLKEIKRVLKKDGVFTLQMGFNADYPYIINKGDITIGNYMAKVLKKDKSHALWREDKVTAQGTNSSCDVTINYHDIPDVVDDFESLFEDVDFWFYDVKLIYRNLDGEEHGAGYWPTHWIFISGKNGDEKTPGPKKGSMMRKLWTKKNNEFHIRDKNSLFEDAKRIARKSKYYESAKIRIKRMLNNND